MNRTHTLSGRRIVVTRPAEQAEKLAVLIESRDGHAVRFPVLAIFDAADPGPLQAAAERIDGFDIAVFVSPNAVEKALGAITAKRAWPERVVAAAMGETPQRHLRQTAPGRDPRPHRRRDGQGRHCGVAVLDN